MQNFFKNIFLAILFFQLILVVVFNVLKKGLIKYDEPIYNQFNKLFKENKKYDVLFLGSSRTHYGINTLIFEKLTGKSALNAGLEGARINEMEIVLEGYLKMHSKPDKLFLMLDPQSFDTQNNRIFNQLYFSNYLSNEALFNSLHKNVGNKVFFWKWIPYSILTEFDDYTRVKCIKGLVNKTSLQPSQYYYNGYVSLKSNYKAIGTGFNINEINFESGKQFLLKILKICSKKKIELKIIQGPYLQSFYDENKIKMFYKNLEENLSKENLNLKFQTAILNYNDTSLFKDETHLNDKGAIKYTKDLYKAISLENEQK